MTDGAAVRVQPRGCPPAPHEPTSAPPPGARSPRSRRRGRSPPRPWRPRAPASSTPRSASPVAGPAHSGDDGAPRDGEPASTRATTSWRRSSPHSWPASPGSIDSLQPDAAVVGRATTRHPRRRWLDLLLRPGADNDTPGIDDAANDVSRAVAPGGVAGGAGVGRSAHRRGRRQSQRRGHGAHLHLRDPPARRRGHLPYASLRTGPGSGRSTQPGAA